MKFQLFILLCFATTTSFGQDFYEGPALSVLRKYNVDNKQLHPVARHAFYNYLSTGNDNSQNIVALYFLGHMSKQSGDLDSANLFFARAIQIPLTDSLDKMDLKNKAAKQLADIAIQRKQFSIALNYLDQATNSFLPKFDCGLARDEDKLEMKILFARCYSGQEQYQKAIDSLAPYMFNYLAAQKEELINLLYTTYRELYPKRSLRKEFSKLSEDLVIEKERLNNYVFHHARLRVFNNWVELPVYDLNLDNLDEQQQKEACIRRIKESQIYKLALAN